MKIGQYCQRQRSKHVELEQFLADFRAGLSAIAGLSCFSGCDGFVFQIFQYKDSVGMSSFSSAFKTWFSSNEVVSGHPVSL